MSYRQFLLTSNGRLNTTHGVDRILAAQAWSPQTVSGRAGISPTGCPARSASGLAGT